MSALLGHADILTAIFTLPPWGKRTCSGEKRAFHRPREVFDSPGAIFLFLAQAAPPLLLLIALPLQWEGLAGFGAPCPSLFSKAAEPQLRLPIKQGLQLMGSLSSSPAQAGRLGGWGGVPFCCLPLLPSAPSLLPKPTWISVSDPVSLTAAPPPAVTGRKAAKGEGGGREPSPVKAIRGSVWQTMVART